MICQQCELRESVITSHPPNIDSKMRAVLYADNMRVVNSNEPQTQSVSIERLEQNHRHTRVKQSHHCEVTKYSSVIYSCIINHHNPRGKPERTCFLQKSLLNARACTFGSSLCVVHHANLLHLRISLLTFCIVRDSISYGSNPALVFRGNICLKEHDARV
jgi:hypothetical protein